MMKEVFSKKGLLIIFASFAVAFLINLSLSKKTLNKNALNTTPAPFLNTNADYSNLNKLTPGKSKEEGAIKINGEPYQKIEKGGTRYFYYKTPSNDYKNVVAFKNGVEFYSLENIFGDYRGRYKDFTASFGKPGLLLHQKDSPFDFSIFLSRGVGVEGNDEITKVLYFVPQEKDSFLKTVAADLNLFEKEPIEVLHP